MIRVIYGILSSVIVGLATSDLLLIPFYYNKHKWNNVKCIKVRLLLSSSLFVLFIPEIIIARKLGQSITVFILCAIMWALSTISGFFTLKEAKEKNVKSADEDVIDLNCKEVQGDETEKESHSKNNLSKQH